MIPGSAGVRERHFSTASSPAVKREQIEKDDMTYAMWGIVVALALRFGVPLRRYRRSLLRKRDIRWLDEHHVLDRLRKQLGS
jgi:hypothetical protein